MICVLLVGCQAAGSVTPLPPTPTLEPTATPIPAIKASDYVLQFEYTTASDWTELSWDDSSVILSMRVVGFDGQIAKGRVGTNAQGKLSFQINRPVPDIPKEPEVTLTVEVALKPDLAGKKLAFHQLKGDYYWSKTKVSLVNNGEKTTLFEETQKDAVSEFAVDLTPLLSVTPLPGQVQLLAGPKKVFAFYYGWYMPGYDRTEWSNAKWTDRPLQPYDSSDPKVIQSQVDAAKSAGIDGFIYATGDLRDPKLMQNFDTLLDIAQKSDFSVIAFYDLLLIDDQADVMQRVLATLEGLFQKEFKHPAYVRLNGKPVVQVFANGKIPVEGWRDIFATLKAEGDEAVTIGEAVYGLDYLNVFDGLYYYRVDDQVDVAQADRYLADVNTYAGLLAARPNGRLSVATVQTGYDNTPLTLDSASPFYGKQPTLKDRAGGDYYRSTWEAAIASNPDWIFITTWNEYQENTQIEPSQKYGDEYLRITKEYVQRWKGK